MTIVLKTQAQRTDGNAGANSDTDTGARGGVKFLREAMRGHWKSEGSSVVAALVCIVAIIAIPELGGKAVDSGLIGHHWRTLGVLGAIIAVLGVVQAVSSGLRRYFNGVSSRHVEAELRRAFFTRLLGFDVGYHDRINRGQLLSRVTSDLFQIQALLASTPVWIANTITIVAVAVVLVIINPLLGLVAVAGLPIVAYTSLRYSMRVRPILGELQRERGDLAGVVEEALSGIRAVKGFGAESILERRLAFQADAVRTRSIDIVRMRCRYNPLLNAMPMFELVAVNWLGGYLVLHHELTVGMLLAFNTYLAVVTGPLQSIGWFVVQVQRALVSARRLETVMSHRAAIQEPAHPRQLPAGSGRVVFDDVAFGYPGNDDLILDGSTSKSPVAKWSPSSADRQRQDDGRRAACPSLRSGAGCCADRGRRRSRVVHRRRACERRCVLRGNFLFDDTIAANLRVGREGATDDELAEAARVAQADEFVAELPGGYASVVGERGLSTLGRPAAAGSRSRAEFSLNHVCWCSTMPRPAVDARRSGRSSRVSKVFRVRKRSSSSPTARRRSPWPTRGADRWRPSCGIRTHAELVATSARYRDVLGITDESDWQVVGR